MADDWEDEDWETADIKLNVPAAPVAALEGETRGAALLAAANKVDLSKFANEDEGGENDADEKHAVPKPQPKKKEEKKWKETAPVDQPLDDPVAEKLRRQRLVEQADYEAARELFGASGVKPLESFLPKSVKDFEDFAAEIANRAVLTHKESKNYKVLIKALLKLVCEPLTSEEAKEVEATAGTIRADKIKAEKAKAAEKKPAKKSLAGAGKGSSAGLDDFVYGDDYADDGDDFM